MNLDALRARYPGRRIDYYPVTGSTMHAAAGLPPGSIAVAGEQTAGQGRHGHTWHSGPGSGLYCSMVLDLALAPDVMPSITLALGLATADAVEQSAGVRCDLRWPNDLLFEERKLAGILVQSAGPTAVAGIGVNVNHAEFPDEIAPLATSLRRAAGRELAREDVLLALVPAVDQWTARLANEGRGAIIEAFTARSTYARGKRVVVALPEGEAAGVTAGLDETGFLRLCRDDGTETLILAGGVRAAGS